MVVNRLICHYTPLTTVDELWHLVKIVWIVVPVHPIQSLYNSMPSRITGAIAAGDGCFSYWFPKIYASIFLETLINFNFQSYIIKSNIYHKLFRVEACQREYSAPLILACSVERKDGGKHIILMQLAMKASVGTECFSCDACFAHFKIRLSLT